MKPARTAWLLLLALTALAACSPDNETPVLHGGNPSSTGPSPVQSTGQTRCYNSSGVERECSGTGEDGELRKGVEATVPRFTDNGDGTVTDNLTGLMWMKDADCDDIRTFDGDMTAGDGQIYWQTGLDFIKALNAGTYDCNVTTVYTDWRMPNINELESLVRPGLASVTSPSLPDTAGSGRWSEGDPFTGVIEFFSFNSWTIHNYMSSSSNAGSTDQMWIMDMGYGLREIAGKSSLYNLWPVRTAFTPAPARPAATGQTICYDSSGVAIDCANTGQDGDLREGVPLPSPRFTDNGDGTVTDNLTGLMWMKEANCIGDRLTHLDSDGAVDGRVTWQHALDFIAGINYGAHDCGQNRKYTDWRLPNYKELASLVSTAFYDPAISNTSGSGRWSEGDPFNGVDSSFYWSSTSTPMYGWAAFVIDLHSGTGNYFDKSTNHELVWPVRGGG